MAKERGEKTFHWTNVFSEQAASGLNVAAFCKKIDISKWKYYYWKRRVGNLPCAAKAIHSGRSKNPEFIEIEPPDFDQKKRYENFADTVEMRIGSVSIFYRSNTDRKVFKEAVSVLIEVAR